MFPRQENFSQNWVYICQRQLKILAKKKKKDWFSHELLKQEGHCETIRAWSGAGPCGARRHFTIGDKKGWGREDEHPGTKDSLTGWWSPGQPYCLVSISLGPSPHKCLKGCNCEGQGGGCRGRRAGGAAASPSAQIGPGKAFWPTLPGEHNSSTAGKWKDY